MDKRLSIALLLTAIIVAVTPILFPTPRKPVTPAAAKGGTATPAVASQLQQPASAGTQSATTVASPTVRADSNAAALSSSSVPAPSAEVTTIETPKSIYKFSNVGAAPVSATMRDYKNLSPAGGLVDLRSMNQSLLRYALVLNRDTIQLSTTSFQASESKSENGHQVLTYRANVQNANIAISYEIIPDKYVLKVAGRVDGAIAGQPFLLIQLPSSLPAQEKDTLVDLRALSYSF
jgi:YidC/Oxa1 family membrane protein insertase